MPLKTEVYRNEVEKQKVKLEKVYTDVRLLHELAMDISEDIGDTLNTVNALVSKMALVHSQLYNVLLEKADQEGGRLSPEAEEELIELKGDISATRDFVRSSIKMSGLPKVFQTVIETDSAVSVERSVVQDVKPLLDKEKNILRKLRQYREVSQKINLDVENENRQLFDSLMQFKVDANEAVEKAPKKDFQKYFKEFLNSSQV